MDFELSYWIDLALDRERGRVATHGVGGCHFVRSGRMLWSSARRVARHEFRPQWLLTNALKRHASILEFLASHTLTNHITISVCVRKQFLLASRAVGPPRQELMWPRMSVFATADLVRFKPGTHCSPIDAVRLEKDLKARM